MKYVILDDVKPIVFSDAQQHSEFKNLGTPTSAGFCSVAEVDARPEHDTCSIKYREVHCYGKSISLDIGSNPDHDKFVLERLFNS